MHQRLRTGGAQAGRPKSFGGKGLRQRGGVSLPILSDRRVGGSTTPIEGGSKYCAKNNK